MEIECIARHAMSERQWVSATIGPSPAWDDRPAAAFATKQPAFLAKVRTLVDAWAGRATND